MKKIIQLCFLLLIGGQVMFLQSCRSMREIALFQASDSLAYKVIPRVPAPISKIQPNDILAITVSSPDKNSNEVLNFANINSLTMTQFPGISVSSQRGQPLGYMVDQFGNVELPFIGKVSLSGYTLAEAADIIRSLVDSSLVADPAVNVRFLNHKFSVLGEVGRAGTFSLIDEKTTLPEALAMAGDIGVYGNRERVMLVRDNGGTQEVARLNLTNEEIFDSPFFYVRNGDVIYVEPLAEKATSTDRRVQLAPIVLSAVSTSIVLLTFIVNAFK